MEGYHQVEFPSSFDSVEKVARKNLSPDMQHAKKRHDLDSDRPSGPPWFAVVETFLPCMPVFVPVVSPLPSTPVLQNVEGGTSFLF